MIISLSSLLDRPPGRSKSARLEKRAAPMTKAFRQGGREPVGSLSERSIAGPGGPLTLRIYRGQTAVATGAPALLYLHSGGWVIGRMREPVEMVSCSSHQPAG
jgi:acetyl esterase